MRITKEKQRAHFRIYVRNENTKQTCSVAIYDHIKLTKEQILDKIIFCLNRK